MWYILTFTPILIANIISFVLQSRNPWISQISKHVIQRSDDWFFLIDLFLFQIAMQFHDMKRHPKITYWKHFQNQNTFGLLVPFTNGWDAYFHDSKQTNEMLIWRLFYRSLQSWKSFLPWVEFSLIQVDIEITSILLIFVSI